MTVHAPRCFASVIVLIALAHAGANPAEAGSHVRSVSRVRGTPGNVVIAGANPAEAGSHVPSLDSAFGAPADSAVVGSAFRRIDFARFDQAGPPQKPDPKGTPKPDPTRSKPQPPAAKPKDPRPLFAVRGFVDLAFASYSAKDSFEAVYGSSTGLMWGGGGQLAHRSGLFVQGRVWSYSATGERVFVHGNEVFPLGIRSEITVVPFEVSGGWRFVRRPRATPPPGKPGQPAAPPPPAPGKPAAPPPTGKPATPPPGTPTTRPTTTVTARKQRVIPYAGGGIGTVKITEKADFAESSDDVDESFTSYHLFGGAEFPLWRWVSAGAEVGWRKVPGALEGTGAAEAFGEKDLDHLYIAFRVIVGK